MTSVMMSWNQPSWKFWMTISGTGHPINFVFDSMVGFSGMVDRTTFIQGDGQLAATFEIWNDDMSAMSRPVDFMFHFRVQFFGMADQMDLLPTALNPSWRLATMLEISNDDVQSTSCLILGAYYQQWVKHIVYKLVFCPSVHMSLSVCLSVCVSVCLSVYTV